MTDLVIRSLAPGEEHLFEQLSDPALVGVAAFGRSYRATAAAGGYRPEWTWVALRGDTVLARAAWFGGPDDDAPFALDWFDFTDADAGVALLRAARAESLKAEYCLLIPPGGRDRPEVRAAVQARADAAVAAGMTWLVDRYRYEWTTACGLPDRPDRLTYRPEPDDAVFLDALRRIQHGTLDAHARRTIAERDLDAAAREELDLLGRFPAPREWWRLGYTPGGDLAGLVVPSRNHAAPVVALVGVVPEQRGHGYAYDLLVEGTHFLTEQGADRILADTDMTNTPMAAAFAKAGYPVTQERIFFA
ncbi:GNAT family N-acetyltransferase [Actinoallomurus vinaceus]|uniref:GNAT family N-acetyltransferase n=1 Tax=Actinoallomurus vinaceus TaxID=1080074 RepID=A0ABP8U9X7_9ACTN